MPAERTAADLLQESAEVYRQRNLLYKDNYKKFGRVMHALFPDGLTINSPDLWNRLGLLVQQISKQTRYCENFLSGGHDDSLCDLSVYSAMLREVDEEIRSKECTQ